jgi:hypothetical protein
MDNGISFGIGPTISVSGEGIRYGIGVFIKLTGTPAIYVGCIIGGIFLLFMFGFIIYKIYTCCNSRLYDLDDDYYYIENSNYYDDNNNGPNCDNDNSAPNCENDDIIGHNCDDENSDPNFDDDGKIELNTYNIAKNK